MGIFAIILFTYALIEYIILDERKSNRTFILTLLGLLTVSLWASAFVGIRYGLHGYHPGSLALLRYLVASFCSLLILFYQKGITRPNLLKKDFILIALSGGLGIGIYNIALNFGEMTLSAAIASFTIAQAPVLATILAVCFLGERLKPVGIIGILISMMGVGLIAYSRINMSGSHATGVGLFYIFVAVACSASYSVLQKPVLNRLHPLQAVCYAIWVGTTILLIYLPQLIQDIQTAPLGATLIAIYMGIFPAALAYFLWGYLLAQDSIARQAAMLYFLPLITMFFGWIFLGEVMPMLAVAGGFVALVGAFLVRQ